MDIKSHMWRRPTLLAAALVFIVVLVALYLDTLFLPKTGVLLLLQLAVVGCAVLCSPLRAVLAALVCALSFNFFFTAPRYTLNMNDSEDIINVLVFFIVGLLTSYVVSYWRKQKHRLALAELRSRILLSVSHDLRTPLAAIMGAIETLETYRTKLSSTEQQELLTSARQESDRLYRYIENILQATRFQLNNELDLTRTKQPLMPIINAVAQRFGDKVRVVDSKLGIQLNAQAPLLEQAIHNVLDNAVSFNRGDAAVEIKVVATSEQALIQVHDNGPGVPPQYQKEIFKPFMSLRSSHGSEGGSGVGLTVAQSIAQAHGGDIRVLPSEQGCTMQICLPIKGKSQ